MVACIVVVAAWSAGNGRLVVSPVTSRVIAPVELPITNHWLLQNIAITTTVSTTTRRPAPMQIARCSLRCGSSNAFRPQQALRCLFFEQKLPLNFDNARRISTTHPKLQEEERPVVETPPADARIPSESSPIPPSEYIDTASLQGSLQTLRRKNRERLLGQEHASTDDPSPSGGQSKDAKVDDLLPERRWAINKATLPKTTDEPQPQARTNSYKAQKITKRKSKYNAVDPLEYTGMYVRPSIGEANPEQEYPWTKDIPDDLRGMAR